MIKFTILLFCLIGVAFATESHSKLPLAGHINLMEFMIATRDATQRDASTSMECFNHYVPILNDITAEYEKNYAACLQTADDARSDIDRKTQQDRYDIEDSAKDACGALVDCTQFTGSEDYFGCFVDAGASNSKVMYTISFNASEILMTIREQIRIIDDQQNRCTNASERIYVESTGSTYEELQACLQGKAPVPASTSAPSTTLSSSTEPASTEPSSTESSSTESSSTESSSTDSSSTESSSTDSSSTEPTSSTTPAPEVSSTTEAESESTEDDNNVEGFKNRNYLPIKDSKWRHFSSKLGGHYH